MLEPTPVHIVAPSWYTTHAAYCHINHIFLQMINVRQYCRVSRHNNGYFQSLGIYFMLNYSLSNVLVGIDIEIKAFAFKEYEIVR